MIKSSKIAALLAGPALLLAGCGDDSPKPSTAPAAETKALLSAELITAEKPADAITITQARTSVVPGQDVTVFGTIGGVISPFVKGRASMVVADHTTLKDCNSTCGSCATPWDFCCELPDKRRKGTLTIQVVDADGKVVKQGLKNFNGLTGNSMVTIQGKYAPEASENMVIINAERIHLQK